MGRLAGSDTGNSSTFEATRLQFDRQAAGSHELVQPGDAPLYHDPNHPGDMPEGTLRAILKQAGVEPDRFVGK